MSNISTDRVSKGNQNPDYYGISRPEPPKGSGSKLESEAFACNTEYVRYESGHQIFDGEILNRRLSAFLSRVDNALKNLDSCLEHYTIENISVGVSLDLGLNVGFAGIVGIDASRSRSFEFTLKRK